MRKSLMIALSALTLVCAVPLTASAYDGHWHGGHAGWHYWHHRWYPGPVGVGFGYPYPGYYYPPYAYAPAVYPAPIAPAYYGYAPAPAPVAGVYYHN